MIAWLGLILGLSAVSGADLSAPEPKSQWNFAHIQSLPVHVGGRLKPFDTYARETVLFLTGSRTWEHWGAVDLMFSWISFPDYWQKQPLIRIQHPDVRRQLLVDESRSRFTPEELFRNPVLMQYANTLMNRPNSQEPMGGQRQGARDQELRRVVERLTLFRNILSGDAWTIAPQPEPQPWQGLKAPEGGTETSEAQSIRKEFSEVVRAYHDGHHEAFEAASIAVASQMKSHFGPSFESQVQPAISREVLYNNLQPFFWAWILYLLSALGWVFTFKKKAARVLLQWLPLGLAVGIHVAGFALRIAISGRPPVSNMYESVLWVGFGTMLFSFFVYGKYKNAVIFSSACFVTALMMAAVDASPAIMDPGIHPLVPVLRSNYWLTIHVLTITLGYSAFALALAISNVSLFQYVRWGMDRLSAEACRSKVSQLNQFSYRAIQIGVVQLAAGTILGGVWADYSWGRFWGWDPKEVWALIALLTYLAILHARMTGWVSSFGFAAGGVLGFLSVLMAWYGVNFVLGAGLHSYGFAQGGQMWVAGFCIVQLAYVGWTYWIQSHITK